MALLGVAFIARRTTEYLTVRPPLRRGACTTGPAQDLACDAVVVGLGQRTEQGSGFNRPRR